MKTETKFKKAMKIENPTIRLSKLYSIAFECVPDSPQQKIIKKEIEKLLTQGVKLSNIVPNK